MTADLGFSEAFSDDFSADPAEDPSAAPSYMEAACLRQWPGRRASGHGACSTYL
jgi:hypothetical protein